MTEDRTYLSEQLVTCLGNKRSLLDFLGQGLERVRRRLGQEKLRLFDVFSGSGVVARYFKKYASFLVSNDLEYYSYVTNSCYLANADEVPQTQLKRVHAEIRRELNQGPLQSGFLSELYAPQDDADIQLGERVFYTARNARYLDTARKLISEAQTGLQDFLLAPLLSEASIHANTSGVFKGFYKNRHTGLGQFGGEGKNALTRILGEITLPYPVFSRYSVPNLVMQVDAAEAARIAPEVDVAYLDPPYNQHPYGSNYFMLNLIAAYRRPTKISWVSGIPDDWNRSDYNRAPRIREALSDLIENLKATFIMVSFNSEGFLKPREMEELLQQFGPLSVLEQRYPTFRGSRNLGQRDLHVKEYLFILEKKGTRT